MDIAEAYHAGLTAAARKRIQNQFIRGKLRIIGIFEVIKNIKLNFFCQIPLSFSTTLGCLCLKKIV
jgi:hypothetical protein